MSEFLRNLIERHQPGDAGSEARRFVQPRPRSRFETASGAGAYPEPRNPADAAVTNAPGAAAAQQARASARQRSATVNGSADPGRSPDAVNRPVNTISDMLERLVPGTPLAGTVDAGSIQIGHPSSPASSEQRAAPTAERADRNGVSNGTDLKPRYQAMPHRSDAAQPLRAGNASSPGARQHNALPNSGAITNGNPMTHPAGFADAIEQTGDFGPDRSVEYRSPASRAEHPHGLHSGVMRTPDWLTRMQRELGSRRRETNTATRPEASINVSIGRVEVRAVHAGAEKQSAGRDRPAGIMSLDDYLKQRDGKQS